MGKYRIQKVPTGCKFNLLAVNGQIIAVSEIYTTHAACLQGIESVRKNAPIANLEDRCIDSVVLQKHPKFELYRDRAGEFRFRLKARNGEIIAFGEGYTTKANCLKGIESIRKNAGSPVEE